MMENVVDQYGAGDDEEVITSKIKRSASVGSMVVEFELDGTKIRAANPTYVTMLEQRITMLEQEMQRLRVDLNNARNGTRRLVHASQDLQRQLDAKIDRE